MSDVNLEKVFSNSKSSEKSYYNCIVCPCGRCYYWEIDSIKTARNSRKCTNNFYNIFSNRPKW